MAFRASEPSPTHMDKAGAVRDMFDRIAARYDRANTVMTGGLDALWRARAVDALSLSPDARVLDLCCGTGALTRQIARRLPVGRVTGVDFSPRMLAVARQTTQQPNIDYIEADVLALPFATATFDAAAMAFSLRNVTDIPACLREVRRVLKPGGRFVNLEVGKPPSALVRRAFFMYFYGWLPLIGGLVGGDRAAYRYLPQSLVNFPDADALRGMFEQAGFETAGCRPLFSGVAWLHWGMVQAARSENQAHRARQHEAVGSSC